MANESTPQAVIHATNEAYFGLISELFEREIGQFHASGLPVAQFLQNWLDDGSVVKFQDRQQEISNAVSQFWSQQYVDLTKALLQLQGLKCTVGSDIFPFHVQEKLLSVGCYVDTFVVQDYVRRIATADATFSPRHAAFGLVAFALEISRLENLFCLKLPIPPIVLLDQDLLNESNFRKEMLTRANAGIRSAMAELFGRDFPSSVAAKEFVSSMPTIDELCAKVVSPTYSITKERDRPFREQLENYIVDARVRIAGFGDNAGEALWLLLLQNISAANEHFIRSDLIDGTPLVHGNLEWEYILRRIDEGKKLDLTASRGIQQGSETPGFLLRYVNEDQLVQLRKEGALEEPRTRIRDAIRSIEVSSVDDVANVTAEVNRELTAMLIEHQRQMKRLASAHKKFFGLEVAPLLGTASLVVAGATIGSPFWNVLAGIAGLAGPSIKSVAESTLGLLKKRREIKKNAAAILCKSVAN